MLHKATQLLITLYIAGCTTHAPQLKTVQSKIQTPTGWTATQASGFKVFFPPEKDNFVATTALPASGLDFKKLSTKLWQTIEPGFSFPIGDYSESQTEGGHRKIKVFHDPGKVYPGFYLTNAIVIDDTAHLMLVKLKRKLYNKRRSQVLEIFEPVLALDKKNQKSYSNQQPADLSAHAADLDQFMTKAVKEIGLQGVAVGIIQNGKVVLAKGYGHTEAGGAKVTKDTLFKIASVSKPLVSLMAAKLVNDGKLSWDDRLTAHLPEWQVKDNALLSKMRIKDSFCACTGIPYRDMTAFFKSKGVTALARINEMKDWQPTSAFGEVYQYSNHLYAAGGYAAARAYRPNLALEAAYDAAITDLVFKPLGMKSSLSHQRLPYNKALAKPHFKFYDASVRPIPPSYINDDTSLDTAGGVWSNVTDMLKYVELELSLGKSQPDYIDQQQLIRRRKKGIRKSSDVYYGLGLQTTIKRGLTIHEHSGGLPGYTSWVAFTPDHDWGYVVLENIGSDSTGHTLLRLKLLALLYGEAFNDDYWLAKAKKAFQQPRAMGQKLLPLPVDAKELVGLYRNKEIGRLRVFVKDGKLWADADSFLVELREVRSDEEGVREFAFYGLPGLLVRKLELHKGSRVRWAINLDEISYTFE